MRFYLIFFIKLNLNKIFIIIIYLGKIDWRFLWFDEKFYLKFKLIKKIKF